MCITFLLLPFITISTALIPKQAYYIQTDEGPNRFFQYSSGPGGQFRKETILPNGTVVGAYSWKDLKGRVRIYSYMADKRGYRVTQHAVKISHDTLDHEISDNHIEEVGGNGLINHNNIDDVDVSPIPDRQSKTLRLRRKVLVKRQKSNPNVIREGKNVRVKKLGAVAATIPYQQTLLLKNQYPGRQDQMRLVGDDGIITLPKINELKEIQDNNVEQIDIGALKSDSLPTSVLLQRVKVQPVSDDIYSSNVTERSQRRRSKLVRRRRRRKNKKTDVKNDRKDDVDGHEETFDGVLADNGRVYFTPL